MSNVLTLKYRDYHGIDGTFQMQVLDTLAKDNTELVAMIEAHVAMSNALLVSATLTEGIDISGITNPAATLDLGNDSVEDQAAFQGRRVDGQGFTRITVPAPLDTIFKQPPDPKAGADVKDDAALVVTFLNTSLNAAVAGKIWEAPGSLEIDYDKGWMKGRRHS